MKQHDWHEPVAIKVGHVLRSLQMGAHFVQPLIRSRLSGISERQILKTAVIRMDTWLSCLHPKHKRLKNLELMFRF